MYKIRKVTDVKENKRHNRVIIGYDDKGEQKLAACVEGLMPEVGNRVEIYSDDYVNYCGFGAMVLKLIL